MSAIVKIENLEEFIIEINGKKFCLMPMWQLFKGLKQK